MTFRSTKNYGHDVGLSCCFRQWRATSHCAKLHGYALAIKYVFAAEELDDKNWVADYGNFKALKAELQMFFDHTTIIAADDPEIEWFREGKRRGILDLIVLDGVGCEMFAKFACELAEAQVKAMYGNRVRVVSCEVSEHGANSSIYMTDVSPTGWWPVGKEPTKIKVHEG